MPLFGSSKSKAAKFDYYLLLHSLSPFPANFKGIYISWQRGSNKKGQSSAVVPVIEKLGNSFATYQFDEAFHVACTLTQDSKAHASRFEKKWLILSIMDGDKSSKSVKEPLGRVVINLADYAADDDKATMSFTVAANKVVSSDVGECKMLITLGCRSKGRPPMNLGGKLLTSSSIDKGSAASSEYSDDEDNEQGGNNSSRHTQPVGKHLSRISEHEIPSASRQGPEQYDEDGFLVDTEMGTSRRSSGTHSQQQYSRQGSRPSQQPSDPLPEPDSDADSEDAFLAQAVLAKERKAPMPVAPSVASQQGGQWEAQKGTIVPGSEAHSGHTATPETPFEIPATTNPVLPLKLGSKAGSRAAPIFALRPEGSDEQPAKPQEPTASARRSASFKAALETPAFLDRGEHSKGGIAASVKELKPKAAAAVSQPARRVSRLVSQFEPDPEMGRDSLAITQAQQGGSLADGQIMGGNAVEQRRVSYPSEDPEGSPRRRQDLRNGSTDFEDNYKAAAGQEGVAPRVSHRRLANESGNDKSDSPRRRRFETSRLERRKEEGTEEERKRSLGVVLPTGAVSISKRPIITAAAEPVPDPESPPITSTPGRHWLDEPEDLGVDPSPTSTPRPAYQAVQPAPISRIGIAKVRDKYLPSSAARAAKGSQSPLAGNQPEPTAATAVPPSASRGLEASSSASKAWEDGKPGSEQQPVSLPAVARLAAGAPSQPKELGKEAGTPLSNGILPLAAHPNSAARAVEVLTNELRAVAALEASVYLVRSSKTRGLAASSKARNAHAPARRLARTTISMGPEEGTIFGLRALRAIEAAADGAGDIAGQAYWWSNCIQLRWMLWAMCKGGATDDEGPDSEEFDWIMQVLVPPLRELEAHIFQQLFQYMWWLVATEGLSADLVPGSQAKHWIIPPSKEEEAVQRWIDAFQMLHRALLPAAKSVTAGHVTLLKHKTLTALMRRLDATLFDRLVEGSDSDGTMVRRDVFSSAWSSQKGPGLDSSRELPLDSRSLPFSLDASLGFGTGVNLKMAATRWTNWAADVGLRNDKGSPEEGYMLFPRLRASADLLMMPKEVLTDRTIRSEVLPGLPLSLICKLLSRFQPDDLARDPLPPGLLEALQNETPPSEGSPSPTLRGLAAYEPPSETALLADGLIEPVSLEMDDESEDELEHLEEMYDPNRQGHTTGRFGLLKELWASAR